MVTTGNLDAANNSRSSKKEKEKIQLGRAICSRSGHRRDTKGAQKGHCIFNVPRVKAGHFCGLKQDNVHPCVPKKPVYRKK
jgi:transposase-like protein